MKRLFVLVLLTLALAGCAPDNTPKPTPAESDIWLEIHFLQNNNAVALVCLLPKKTFDAIVSGGQKSGWLELKNVYWRPNGYLVPQEIAKKQRGYGSSYIVRIEDLVRMIPLSEEAVQALHSESPPSPSTPSVSLPLPSDMPPVSPMPSGIIPRSTKPLSQRPTSP